MEKWVHALIRLMIPLAVVVLPCVILWGAGIMTVPMECFAIDSKGLVYIGNPSEVEVYKNNKLVDSFSAQTSRGYHFCIENDVMLLQTSTNIFRLQLDGSILSKWDINDIDAPTVKKATNELQDADGNTYVRDRVLIRERIIKNGKDIVYQISIANAIVRSLLLLCIIFFVVFGTVIVCKYGKPFRRG